MPTGKGGVAVGALAALVGAAALAIGCAIDPVGVHLFMTLPGYRILPIGAYTRGYQPRSLEENSLMYEHDRPEYGGDRVTSRLIWPADCEEDPVVGAIPFISPQDPAGCAMEDTIDQELEDRRLLPRNTTLDNLEGLKRALGRFRIRAPGWRSR